MRVAIVTVGDELLAGDTVNTNATWLADNLTDRGVAVERVTTVPDRVADIARVVNEYHAEYDAVVVTGGLGPTHDDVTMDGVAAAFGRPVETHAGALSWLTDDRGYAADDLVSGTADLPADARFLRNPEGVAPGCVVERCYVLPGVPAEMKGMFALVADEFEGERTYSESVEADEPESALIDRMQAVQDRFDVSIGSYPGETVRLKVTSVEEKETREAAAWLRDHVDLVEGDGVGGDGVDGGDGGDRVGGDGGDGGGVE